MDVVEFAAVLAFAVVMLAGFYLLDRARHRRDLAAYRQLREEDRRLEAVEDGDEWKN